VSSFVIGSRFTEHLCWSLEARKFLRPHEP